MTGCSALTPRPCKQHEKAIAAKAEAINEWCIFFCVLSERTLAQASVKDAMKYSFCVHGFRFISADGIFITVTPMVK